MSNRMQGFKSSVLSLDGLVDGLVLLSVVRGLWDEGIPLDVFAHSSVVRLHLIADVLGAGTLLVGVRGIIQLWTTLMATDTAEAGRPLNFHFLVTPTTFHCYHLRPYLPAQKNGPQYCYSVNNSLYMHFQHPFTCYWCAYQRTTKPGSCLYFISPAGSHLLLRRKED